MSAADIALVLARRLPASPKSVREALAKSYLDGVEQQALARTTGTGPVPTTLATERAELLAYVSRALGRLVTEDEIAALLRITSAAARSAHQNMLAVYDDLPVLALKAAFEGAKRDGRGSEGDITDGYRVGFSSKEKMGMAEIELDRRGLAWEVIESSASVHKLLIDSAFAIDEVLPS